MITQEQKLRLQRKVILQTIKDLDGSSARERVDAIKYFYDQRQAAGIRVQQPLELRRKALDAAKLKGAQRTRAVNDIVEEIEEEFSRNMPSWASS